MGYSNLEVTPRASADARKQPSDDGLFARAGTAMSDDQILDRSKTRARVMRRTAWVLTGGFSLMAAAIAFAIFTGHAALVTGMWGQIVILAVAAALFVYAVAIINIYYRRPLEADGPRLLYRQMDSHQRSWRQLVLFNVFMMFFVVMSLMPAFLHRPAAPFLRAAPQLLLLIGAAPAGFVLVFALILSAGPGWESVFLQPGARELLHDEFNTAQRARTMRFGYILVMLLLYAVLLVALWRPDLTRMALSWALYAGFALPALYFVIADWRASHGDEG
jgi:MFS family permease